MRAVLFDLDGTLVDTRRLYGEAYSRAFEEVLGEMPSWEDFLRRGPTSERLFLVDWYGEDVGGRIHARMAEVYAARAEALHPRDPFEGVRELLAGVRAAGLLTGIVTGKSRACFEVTRAMVDLGEHGAVVVEDDVPKAKPEPLGIAMALEALGVAPQDAVYLGDTTADLEASRRAGVRPAAALWGRRPGDRAGLTDEVWALSEPIGLLERLGIG